MRMPVRKAIVAGLLALLGAPAAAQSAAVHSFFFGASVGQSDYDRDVTTNLITVGAEIAYLDLGEAGYSGNFFGTPVTNGTVGVWGYNAALLARLPLGERLELFGKLGVFLFESEASDVTGTEPSSSTTRSWEGGSFGLGAGWRFTHNLAARAEWERFRLVNGDVELFSLGLQYNF
jgi:hypothetical protein